MTLRDKYNHAIQVAKGFRMQGSADERDGKLFFHGTVNNQDEANRISDAPDKIKPGQVLKTPAR
jgi:hypothetical protein